MPPLYTIILLSIDPADPSGDGGGFVKSGGQISPGAVPFIKSFRCDVPVIGAVFKSNDPVVSPRASKENRFLTDTVFTDKATIAEQKP